MTAYELASLHAQVGETINALLANWLAMLSLYLGAGYLVAHRMSLSSALAVNVIAISVLAGYANEVSRFTRTFVGVSAEIQKVAASHGGLEWHQAVHLPAFAIAWFPTFSFIMMMIVIAAAVYFFFSSRRQNLNVAAQAGAVTAS